ncbi:hypothetical protein QTO34_002359, partial [Cnephaeus nilssonii]
MPGLMCRGSLLRSGAGCLREAHPTPTRCLRVSQAAAAGTTGAGQAPCGFTQEPVCKAGWERARCPPGFHAPLQGSPEANTVPRPVASSRAHRISTWGIGQCTEKAYLTENSSSPYGFLQQWIQEELTRLLQPQMAVAPSNTLRRQRRNSPEMEDSCPGQAKEGWTCIAFAQCLYTTQNWNIIAVMSQGTVIGKGSQELLAQKEAT